MVCSWSITSISSVIVKMHSNLSEVRRAYMLQQSTALGEPRNKQMEMQICGSKSSITILYKPKRLCRPQLLKISHRDRESPQYRQIPNYLGLVRSQPTP